MSLPEPFFRGQFAHTMDAKGRTSIPSAFRLELESRSEGPPFLTPQGNCLALYPRERWIAFERKLSEASAMQPDLRALRRFFFANSVECPIDAQGRILVPPHLRERANLVREVTIAGAGHFIEIWDKGRLDADLTQTQQDFDRLSAALAALGM